MEREGGERKREMGTKTEVVTVQWRAETRATLKGLIHQR